MAIERTDQTGRNEGALLGGDPTAILKQEREGQQQMLQNSQLPTEGLSAVAEVCGIEVVGVSDGDPLFSDVTLPDGWEIKPTDHDMWTTLHDETGLERAAIFYKAAFYDRKAHVQLSRNGEKR